MEMKSLRQTYGETLVKLGKDNKNIISLDADLGKSTMSRSMLQLGNDRFIEVGIAEQNMASISAGLALAGKIPFFSSFAVFVTGRAYDQIRSSICIPELNVKICGSSCGLSDYGDGKTHQSIDDISLMNGLPHMTVFAPVDANQVEGMVEAMVNHKGPCYIRIPRNDLPLVTEKKPYKIGQVDVLREGKDLVILSCGASVHTSLEAAAALSKEGIEVTVANIGTIKPFPSEVVRDLAKKTGAVLVVEEHNKIGGLGSAVFSALAGMALKTGHMGMEDSFGQSAENYDLLLAYYKLTAQDIASTVKSVLA